MNAPSSGDGERLAAEPPAASTSGRPADSPGRPAGLPETVPLGSPSGGSLPLLSPPGGSLPFASSPRPTRPRATARSMYRLHRLLEPNAGYRWLVARLDRSPRLRRLFTAAEKSVKKQVFGCRMCAQCALPVTGYACPMTCPKQLRNGPCGGVGADGSCEVYPEMPCVWVMGFERASGHGRSADLQLLQRPIDHRLWEQSSWIRYWQGHDEDLWTRE